MKEEIFSFKKTVEHIGRTKRYRDGEMFFVKFVDGQLSMFSSVHLNLFKIGDEIEFEAIKKGDWLTVKSNYSIKVISSIKDSQLDSFVLLCNYVSRLKQSNQGEYYFVPSVIVEDLDTEERKQFNVVVPTSVFPDINVQKDFSKGCGRLVAKGLAIGNAINVKEFVSFTPAIKSEVVNYPLSNCCFGDSSISFKMDDQSLVLERSDLSFDLSSALNKIKKKLNGYFALNVTYRQRAFCKRDRNEWLTEFDWEPWSINYVEDQSMIDDELHEFVKAERVKVDPIYRKLISSFIGTSFSKVKVTDKERNMLREYFFPQEYDLKFFELLEQVSQGDIYMGQESFVFHYHDGNHKYMILEQPDVNAATYIFNDTLNAEELLSHLVTVTRRQIIQDVPTQQALGYVGRVVHHNLYQWKTSVLEKIELTTDQLLEERFQF